MHDLLWGILAEVIAGAIFVTLHWTLTSDRKLSPNSLLSRAFGYMKLMFSTKKDDRRLFQSSLGAAVFFSISWLAASTIWLIPSHPFRFEAHAGEWHTVRNVYPIHLLPALVASSLVLLFVLTFVVFVARHKIRENKNQQRGANQP